MEKIEERIKVILVGSTGVGKTSITSRLRDNSFNENSKPTIGMDLLLFQRDVKERKKVPFALWDTAGMERFRSMSPFYYKGTKCVFVVFDLTDKISFQLIDKWRDEIDNFCNFKVKMFLVGNKSDMDTDRDVPPYEEINESSKKLGFSAYSEVSALENRNREIETMFIANFDILLDQDEFETRESPLDNMKLRNDDSEIDTDVKKTNSCC